MKAEDPTHPLTAARPLARAAAALACALAMASGLAGAGCAGSPARAGSLARAGSPVPASAISRLTVIGGRAAKACGDTAPLWMTAVLTTHAKALTSATPGDFVSGAGDVPVFLVTMRGNFVPTAASRPPGAPAPAGSYLSIVVDARTFQVLDSGISPSPPPVSPASLGPVTYLAGQCQEILTELDLPLDVAMTFNCVGEVHCAMGQFTKAGTCYAFAAEQSIACGGIGEQARAVKGQAVAASAAGAGERAKDPTSRPPSCSVITCAL